MGDKEKEEDKERGEEKKNSGSLRNLQKSHLEKLMANPVRFCAFELLANKLHIGSMYYRISLSISQKDQKDGNRGKHLNLCDSTWVSIKL